MKILLEGGMIYTMASEKPIQNGALLIEGDRIRALGPDGTIGLSVRPDLRIRIRGRTILPGLIDAHLHVGSCGHPDYMGQRIKDTAPFVAIRAADNARKNLDAGFTTIRDAGTIGYADVACKRAIQEGLVKGPRMLVSGHMLMMTGPDGYFRPEVTFKRPGIVNSPDEARYAARQEIKMGADVIKIIASGSIVADEASEPGAAQLTVEEMKAAIDVAHEMGKKAMAHSHGARSTKNAILAGIDSIEHGTLIDQECIELMLERNVFLVPTLMPACRLLEHGVEGGIPRYLIDRTRMIMDQKVPRLQKAKAQGVKVAFGTDCGMPYFYHGQNALEFEKMVDAGFTPLEALRSATAVGAECLGLQNQLGTLEPGKLASLLVLDGDPAKDIRILQDPTKIRLIINEGAVYKNTLSETEKG
jgi:imidazolonepropionase-like amidohydrolase